MTTISKVLIFLETTIQADRVVGTVDRKQTVANNLSGRTLISSTCVLGEFIDTFVHDAVIFRKLVADSPSTNDALKRLQVYRERTTKRAISIFASITDSGSMDKLDVLDVLDRWIDWELIDRFHQGLAAVVEGAGCAKAWASAVEDDGGYRIEGLSYTKAAPPDCRIEAFLNEHRDELQKIVAALERLSSRDVEQDRMLQTSQIVLDGLDTPFGRNCQSIKDIVIGLEAPQQSEIYTRNRIHFEPICAALSKTLHQEP